MKVAVISNNKSFNIEKKSNYIIDKLKNSNVFYTEKLDIISDIKKIEHNFDVYMLITNSIDEVLLCKRKVENNRKVLILTESTDVKFIMCCIEFTKNLLYLNVDFDIILQKLYNIYEEIHKLTNNKL